MVYRIAICDDETKLLSTMTIVLKNSFLREKQIAVIDAYSKSNDLLRAVQGGIEYDAYFLDIDIPVFDGINLGQKIQEKNGGKAAIIYISSKEEKVYETFKVRPLRFIRKNSFLEEIGEATRAVIRYLSGEIGEEVLAVEVDDKTVSVPYGEILYVESVDKYQEIVTEKRRYKISDTMEALEEKLSDKGFIRTHRSYLVNYLHIYLIKSNNVQLDSGEDVPMSRLRRDTVKLCFQKFAQSL